MFEHVTLIENETEWEIVQIGKIEYAEFRPRGAGRSDAPTRTAKRCRRREE